MPDIVIADTSCFIVLSNIDQLELLQKLYTNITTTPDIASEFGQLLPEWVVVRSAADQQKQLILELQVDKGEASAIALALETPQSVLIIDDLEGRTLAKRLGITITGTIGIIVRAKLNGVIPSVIPLLAKIKQTNFRLSQALETEALKAAGEL